MEKFLFRERGRDVGYPLIEIDESKIIAIIILSIGSSDLYVEKSKKLVYFEYLIIK